MTASNSLNISGTAGQVLQSTGSTTAPALSTATYPSTSGTSGNILTSNGTNWTSAAPATSGTVTSVSGTANQVAVANGTTTPVISLIGPYTPATYTAHGLLVGEATSSIVALGAGSAGQVLQSGGASADPTYSTSTYPSTATSTGTILRANGTNWVATTATYPTTTTSSQLLYSSADNTVGGLVTANSSLLVTSTGGVPSLSKTLLGDGSSIPMFAFSDTGNAAGANIALYGNGATTPFKFLRSVNGFFDIVNSAYGAIIFRLSDGGLISGTTWNGTAIGTQYGGTGQNFSASTGVMQLSAGTASASTALASGTTATTQAAGTNNTTVATTAYVDSVFQTTGTFTPTLVGTVAGTTTYSTQAGFYIKNGNEVTVTIVLVGTGATGTGNAIFGGLPFTSQNTANKIWIGRVMSASAAGWVWPVGGTSIVTQLTNGVTTFSVYVSGTASVGGVLQMANAAFNYQITMTYQVA